MEIAAVMGCMPCYFPSPNTNTISIRQTSTTSDNDSFFRRPLEGRNVNRPKTVFKLEQFTVFGIALVGDLRFDAGKVNRSADSQHRMV